MAVSRSSSDTLARALRWLLVAVLLVAAGCVTVRPEDKEYLADPSMSFDDQARVSAHEQHVFNNREGSYGAAGVSGGGCGCN